MLPRAWGCCNPPVKGGLVGWFLAFAFTFGNPSPSPAPHGAAPHPPAWSSQRMGLPPEGIWVGGTSGTASGWEKPGERAGTERVHPQEHPQGPPSPPKAQASNLTVCDEKEEEEERCKPRRHLISAPTPKLQGENPPRRAAAHQGAPSSPQRPCLNLGQAGSSTKQDAAVPTAGR